MIPAGFWILTASSLTATLSAPSVTSSTMEDDMLSYGDSYFWVTVDGGTTMSNWSTMYTATGGSSSAVLSTTLGNTATSPAMPSVPPSETVVAPPSTDTPSSPPPMTDPLPPATTAPPLPPPQTTGTTTRPVGLLLDR
ncbi:hypothetical protein B0H10DRAFT_2034075, partial [Mycena sp. CBHHK59/15]